MSVIYHLLGAEIAQHNQTLLRFLQREILPCLSHQTHRFYVVGQPLIDDLASWDLQWFDSQKAFARAVVHTAQTDSEATFILHGQFNRWIWLALFCRKLPACRVVWHVWGADLYEVSTQWRFKWFYPFRRQVQKMLPRIWATQGDLAYVWQQVRPKSEKDRLIYFPTKMAEISDSSLSSREGNVVGEIPPYPPLRKRGSFAESISYFDKEGLEITEEGNVIDTRIIPPFHKGGLGGIPPRDKEWLDKIPTILLGNSGDPSNQHCKALTDIYRTLGQNVNIIVPMGYPSGNERYIQQVEQHAKRYFPAENLQILRQRIDFSAYQRLLQRCDLGYFNFERQQGIGTICLLLQARVPLVLNGKNPFVLDLQTNGVPFLLSGEISREKITAARQALSRLDLSRVAFFPPNYREGWIQALGEL